MEKPSRSHHSEQLPSKHPQIRGASWHKCRCSCQCCPRRWRMTGWDRDGNGIIWMIFILVYPLVMNSSLFAIENYHWNSQFSHWKRWICPWPRWITREYPLVIFLDMVVAHQHLVRLFTLLLKQRDIPSQTPCSTSSSQQSCFVVELIQMIYRILE